jgi:hypothetical protein
LLSQPGIIPYDSAFCPVIVISAQGGSTTVAQTAGHVSLPREAASEPAAKGQVAIVPATPVSPVFQYGGPYFAGVAAVLAAGLAAFIALRSINASRQNLILQLTAQQEIAARTTRASVISANRQKWIDGIREDLAEFIAADFVLLDDSKVDESKLSEAALLRHTDRVADAKRTRRLMFRRIQLRLNPSKASHQDLLLAIKDLMPATGREHLKARDHLVAIARTFLRQEWVRVKREAGDGIR